MQTKENSNSIVKFLRGGVNSEIAAENKTLLPKFITMQISAVISVTSVPWRQGLHLQCCH